MNEWNEWMGCDKESGRELEIVVFYFYLGFFFINGIGIGILVSYIIYRLYVRFFGVVGIMTFFFVFLVFNKYCLMSEWVNKSRI